jgi:CHASE3 domain sensor protein
MHSRAARLMLFCLFVAAVSVAGFLFWQGAAQMQTESTRARALDAAAHDAARTLLDVRAGQFAYIAAGQGPDFWTAQVAHALDTARGSIKALRTDVVSPQAVAALDATESAIEDSRRVDKRAVERVRNGERLLASDIIFADGLELNEAALTSLEQARSIELQARESAVDTLRRRQLFALTAGAAASVLTVLLLVPAGPRAPSLLSERAAPGAAEPPAQPRFLEDDGWNSPRRIAPPPERVDATPPVPVIVSGPTETTLVDEAATESHERGPGRGDQNVSSVLTTTDFPGLASLCVDLARISDTRALPNLLDRAATLLDAQGIILWIADPDGRELNPIFARGYPAQLVNRLGTIPKEAENATAAAFRTSLLQTVDADEISPGAIAAPLVTSTGCVGVMAAEVRHEGERQQMTLAAATIVAAQLATLVGPPSARPQTKSGSAGAS